MARERKKKPERKRVWNIDPWTKTFTQFDSKGRPGQHHVLRPFESVSLPVHQADRLMADGGWVDEKPEEAS